MGTLDKLVKALEALKISKEPPSTIEDETLVRRKKKVELCNFVADTMCSPNVKGAANFPSLLSFSMETLLQLCDDSDSNIRLVADESLNRIIRAMMDNNIVKVHVELHKEIKKNGSVRSLRAALWRFAQLAHMIRPQKGKAYIQNLVPSLIEIAKRREEPVLETLAASLPRILSALGNFTTDNNIRDLLKSLLVNLSSDITVVRRTAATSIVSVCLHSRKPSVFFSYTLNSLLDGIVPVKEGEELTVQGTLNCVRLLLPHLTQATAGDHDCLFSVDRFIQIYELCLHLSSHPDHNMVTTALETLHQLLTSAPRQLLDTLLSPQGISRSHIHTQAADTEKLSRRSLSEMSVASVTADSPLLDTQEEIIQDGRLVQWIHSSSTSSQIDSASEESDTENIGSRREVLPILVGPSIERAPSLEADMLLARDTPSPEATDNQQSQSVANVQVWEVGSTLDAGQPALLHCCRRLVTGFLLPEGNSGPRMRVSVRALALQCLTQLVRVQPSFFFCTIDVNSQATADGFSHVSDVLCFATHSDQQLRGLCCVLVGTFICSSITTAATTFDQWVNTCQPTKPVTLPSLVSLLTTGLQDESSTCVRHALTSLCVCLGPLLCSHDHQTALPILPALLRVADNSYWLVKVKLLELLGYLSYLHIHHVTGNSEFQSQVLHSVMLALLGDEDARVRKAASEAITRACENMFHPVDWNRLDIVNCAAACLRDIYLTGLFDRDCEKAVSSSVEGSLSRVIYLLSRQLLQSSSKHLTAGCCEALSSLADKFPPSTYPKAWHCYLKHLASDTKSSVSASGLLGVLVAMLTASPLSLDLDVHNWLLLLAASIYTGLATMGLKEKELNEKMENKQLWSHFQDPKMAGLSESLLQHLVRMLCVFVRVLEEAPGPKNTNPSPVKRRPTRSSSPAKLTPSTGEKDAGKEEKGKFGNFTHLPHYSKLFDNLRSAYTNHKTQLECGDKMAGLLGSVLLCISQVLEFSTLAETGRCAEELLLYLRVVVSLEPTASVATVQQLLKSLFGSNRVAAWEEEGKMSLPEQHSPSHCNTTTNTLGFYDLILHRFLQQNTSPTESDILPNNNEKEAWNQRKTVSIIKGLMKSSDRHALASYIRLFEPMVIQALKQYTVTNNVRLQVAVLSLLTQLVQLRVNYCLLDSDQIFIEFVLKQFEFLEAGQINQAEVLTPKMFEFLVHLSYEKNHSKPVIGVAKVIQLCDGLMASGQDPLTHCIPALAPIVEHVFTATSSTSVWQVKTQRDVVIAMLLRLAEYPQVLSLLSQILIAERGGEESKRWSHQTADVLMPLLAQGRVRLDSAEAIVALLNLLNSLLPRTLSPPDPVLRVLFTSQLFEIEYSSRSLSTMLAMLLYIIGRDEEDSFLARLEDLKLCVREQSDDPLNATAANLNDPPQTVFARLLLRTLLCLTTQLHSATFCSYGDPSSASYLQYLLAHFLLCCCHLLKSSSHQVIAAGLVALMAQTEAANITQLSKMFVSLAPRCPLVVVLWCRLLAFAGIGHCDKAFWSTLVGINSVDINNFKHSCLNLDVVHRGSLIVFCDFIASSARLVEDSAWLLGRHFPSLLSLYTEPPVYELLEACKNNPATAGLLLPPLATVAANNPTPWLVSKILDLLFSVSLDDSGSVLTILTMLLQHPHLVLARRASALACSRVEYLLILEREEVVKMLDHDDLLNLLRLITTKNSRLATKHSGLVSLLNKLATTHYDMTLPCEQGRNVNTTNIQSICLDKAWFLTQVRLRCCQVESAQQCSQLLSQLDYDDIVSVMRCQQFNNCILQHCFILGTQLTMQERKTPKTLSEHLSPLHLAARTTLLQHLHHLHTLLPRVHQVYSPVGRLAFPKETKYTERLNELFGDAKFVDTLVKLVPAVVAYLASTRTTGCDPSPAAQDLVTFGVLCTEVVHWMLRKSSQCPSLINNCLECAVDVLQLEEVSGLLFKYSHVVHWMLRKSSQCPSLINNCLECAVDVLQLEEVSGLLFKYSHVVHWMLRKSSQCPSLIHNCLECAVDVLQLEKVPGLLSVTHLGSLTSALARLVYFSTRNNLIMPRQQGNSQLDFMVRIEDGNNFTLPKPNQGNYLNGEDEDNSPEVETVVVSHTCLQVAALVSWLENVPQPLSHIPPFIINSIRGMVQSVSRCPPVLWHSVTPPDAWPPTSTAATPPAPPPPPPPLHDIDLLRQQVFRISLVGWTSRTQFEETWMSLLTVLSASPSPDSDQDEIQAIMQGSSVAVQAITSLLVQTLLQPSAGNPNTGRLMHSSRDLPLNLPEQWGGKLEIVTDALYWKLRECRTLVPTSVKISCLHDRCNIERLHNVHRYGYSQVSVNFLKTAVMSAEERAAYPSVNSDYEEHLRRISESGLDLHSCLQFLLDLYSQWTQPEVSVPLNLLVEVVRSTVILSDLFSERSHWAWLLDLSLELSRSHTPEDEILHQYLLLAACKSAAILPALETEASDRVLRLLEAGLKANFSSTRLAAVHGLLYLLESFSSYYDVAGDRGQRQRPVTVLRLLEAGLKANFSSTRLAAVHGLMRQRPVTVLRLLEAGLKANFSSTRLAAVHGLMRLRPVTVLRLLEAGLKANFSSTRLAAVHGLMRQRPVTVLRLLEAGLKANFSSTRLAAVHGLLRQRPVTVLRLLEAGLKANFSSTRLAAVHGLLRQRPVTVLRLLEAGLKANFSSTRLAAVHGLLRQRPVTVLRLLEAGLKANFSSTGLAAVHGLLRQRPVTVLRLLEAGLKANFSSTRLAAVHGLLRQRPVTVLRLLEAGLKANFSSTRLAAVHGLMYLLESFSSYYDETEASDRVLRLLEAGLKANFSSTGLAAETEASDRVLRLLEAGLKANFSSTRLAAVHGLMYLLESFIHVKTEENVSETPSKVPDTRQRLLSMAKEFINKHFTTESSTLHSEDSQLVVYSLVFYLMEHSPNDLPSEVQSHLLQLVISTSSGRQIVLYQALMQGVSRLVLAQVPGLLEPVTRLAMDRLNQSDPAVSLLALRLLLICMYSGDYSRMRGQEDFVDPEQLVATMEKTSALFDRVKKGSPSEVECVCAVLPYLLADFFPASEMLTKVIGEFLSPQQPNHRHLSAVVFQVLSQACREDQLPLLQAWLVMSLHIFTQTLPVATSTWCLACFFISASTNPWLRAIFPHVQSRMGKFTYEDRKLLCIAASDFYRQLTDDKQKETFYRTFKEAASTPRSPFADVIASL
ncbi:huntingtin-like [Macrosteles quadrilineatus]|uniref:huntingtin-like n=1 Tax=Macrosteles quadrilineatus TaxID=74068 RepID=UPI0023E13813|nr:huntingtin-like [Macrosteles quadrilineatus]